MAVTIKHATLTAEAAGETITTAFWDEDHEIVGLAVADVDGLQAALDDKADAAATQTALDDKADADLSNVTQAAARTKVGTGTMAYRNVTISTAEPSGGADGDIWFQVEE